MVQATVNSQDQPRKLAQLQRKREKRGEKGEKLESKKEGSNQNYKIGKKWIYLKIRNFKNGESRYKNNNERSNKERTWEQQAKGKKQWKMGGKRKKKKKGEKGKKKKNV